jgi:WD40 repeat protein
MAQQVGQALAAAHRHGVLHQDIKPANVLLDELQNAYLADFGIAKNLGFAEGSSLTEAGALVSSPAYLSPEQIRDEPVYPASDVYCFGLLLFEMLTGQKAFSGPTPGLFLQQHLHQPLPLLREFVPDLPPALDAVLQQATAKQLQQRYATMTDLLTALDSALQPVSVDKTLLIVPETAVSPLSSSQIAALENPYLGLRAFAEADANHFFGRETFVQELLSLLSDGSDLERFLAVVGPSGSGKSSVVKAGLLPALRRGGLPGSDNWFIVDMTPGSQPWQEVAAALHRVAVQPPDDLLALLQTDNRGLLRAAQTILPNDTETDLVLLIDQFEELFTLVTDEAVRVQFLDSLVTAVLDPHSRLRIIITMRADFTDRPLQYVDFGELLRQRLCLVLPLTVEELSRVITRPLAHMGLAMTPELVATIIRDVGDQPGMLPLLQYALTELFEQRSAPTLTLADYTTTGGVTSALSHRADEIYNGLDVSAQEATRQLFLRLITLGEGVEDTRRRVLKAELMQLDDLTQRRRDAEDNKHITRPSPEFHPSSLILHPLEEYGRYRLLTFDHDPVTRGPTVEVAHEALLREWPLLRGWLHDSREDVRRQRELAAAAHQWQANHQDDSYLLRGSRLTSFEAWAETTTVALTSAECIFLETSVTTRDARHAAEAARQQRELETAQHLAQEQTQRAEEQTRSAQALRKRALFLAGALMVAALLAVIAVGLARSSNNNAALAAQQRDIAQVSERNALESYSLSLAANARQALAADNQPLALLLALAANSVEEPPLAAWRTLVDVAYAPGVNRQFTHNSSLNAVDVSPDGNYLLTGSDDGLVLLWATETGEIVQQLDGHAAAVQAVAFSPDGHWALSGSADDTAVLWNLDSGELAQRLVGHKGDVSGVAFTPDGKQAVTSEDTAAAPSDLIVWDVASGEMVRRFGGTAEGNQEGILDMALSGNGRSALVGQFNYAGTNEHTLVLWDVDSGEPIHFFSEMDRTIAGVAISPDGRFGLAAAADDLLYYFDISTALNTGMSTGELVRRLQGHEGSVLAVAFSPDGKQAVSASQDQTIIWWDLVTGTMIERLRSGAAEIHSLHFLGDTEVVSAATDGSLQIWDLTSAWQLARWGANGSGHLPPLPGPENRGMGLTISPDGRYALSGGNDPDTDLILWDYETGTALRHLTGSLGNIYDVAFTPGGKQALAATQDGALILWNLTTGEVIRRLEGHQGSVNSVEISSNGRYAISGSLGGDVIYWDLNTGEILQRLIGHFNNFGVYDVAFLPGEQQAVSSSWDGSMVVWDLQSGEQVQRLTGLTGNVGSHFSAGGDWGIHGISLSPDGTQLLSAGRDESLLLWDIATGESLRRFSGHTAFVVEVAFSPDRQTALSSARNDFLIVWDVATGTPIRRLPINSRLNSDFRPTLAVHANGRSALSTEADGTILKWQLTEPEPATLLTWLAANRHLRELTCAERETYGIEPLCEVGVAEATTSDLLTAVEAATQTLATQPAPGVVATPKPMSTRPMMANFRETAVLGDNLGELARNQFDVWTYEGRAGEVLQFQMLADNPLTDSTIPLEARYDAGQLDTLLFVIGPDGTQLAKANDDRQNDDTPFSDANDGASFSDANIEAVVLPEAGTYRIEARSFLDDSAGRYTLRLTSRAYAIDPAILPDYEGHYLEGPWEYDVDVYAENGRLYLKVSEAAQTYELIPLSDNEFIDFDGSHVLFLRDENNIVTGYQLWVSTDHSIGGQWYEAAKLAE